MPNYAYTDYCIENGKELYSIMKELEELPKPGLVENGFGSTWLGNLVIKLGGDWNKVSCRGEWSCLEIDDNDVLRFSTETAWNACYEVHNFLRLKFPDIRIYYLTEEEGMAIYETNDFKGKYFNGKYKLWVEKDQEEYLFPSDIDELASIIRSITGSVDVESTFESCAEALDSYCEDKDYCYTLNELDINYDEI